MATEKPESKRKGGGGKLARSEIVTVRMDTQLHYMAELAARKHRRTLSSFVEWAVQHSFRSVKLNSGSSLETAEAVFLSEVEDRLWDVDPAERFARLAILYPDLLAHEEQERWKMLTDSKLLSPAIVWDGSIRKWDWSKLEDVVFPVLRRHWATFLAAHGAGDEASKNWVSEVKKRTEAGTMYPVSEPVLAEPPKRLTRRPEKLKIYSSVDEFLKDDDI